jgi:hypothetical protein
LGTPFDIYSVGIEGGPTAPVYATAANEQFPAYSPDGTKMVFDSDGVPMIGNADGSGAPLPLEIGGLVGVGSFDWAPKQVAPVATGSKAPNGRIGKHPKKRSHRHLARFTFFSDLPGSSFECKLDRKPLRRCASPFRRRVKVGRHRFRLRAVAPDGTPDPTPAIYRWRVLAG